MNIHALLLLAQIPSAETSTVKLLTDAGAVVILSIALLVLAYSLYLTTKNRGQDEQAESTRFDKLVDRLVEVFSTLQNELVSSRKVIAENSETQRLTAEAATVQTGAIQKMDKSITEMGVGFSTLARKFGDYQTLQTETVQNVLDEMVSFKGEIQESINRMLEQITVTNNFVEQAVNEHQIIITTGKHLMDKADAIIALFPPQPAPVSNVVNVNTATPAVADTAADGEAATLPKAS